MKILSVNVGLPKKVPWRAGTVRTGIFKQPVAGPVMVSKTQIEGDGQADRVNHGGTDKAIYMYASEHYPFWEDFLQKEVEIASFGENLTTEGMLENDVFIGDEFQFGAAVLVAMQPRMPCGKLGVRFNDAKMTKHFFRARKNGIYFKVTTEGMISPGDDIILLNKSSYNVTVQDVADNYSLPNKDLDKIREILAIPFLPKWFRTEFTDILRES